MDEVSHLLLFFFWVSALINVDKISSSVFFLLNIVYADCTVNTVAELSSWF